MAERSEDPSRPYNTSVLFDPTGAIAATYRKVHLFDVSLPDGTALRESAATSAGADPVTAEVLGIRLGLPYEVARAQYEIGRHLPEGEVRTSRLRQAQEGFERLGCEMDLQRLQQLQGRCV